mgnify:CR=1 FL=1
MTVNQIMKDGGKSLWMSSRRGGGEESSRELEVPFLGSLPFDPGIVRGGDDGVHRIIADPEGETAKAFQSIVEGIVEQLEKGSQRSLRII